MLLHSLVNTSNKVAATSSRLAKIKLLADLLKQASPDEIEIAIAYLSGSIRQAKIGVGWATLQGAKGQAAETPRIEIKDVDAALDLIANTAGKGSAALKTKLLRDLFSQASAEEQDFLFRLLTGELRQGALELIMVEAVAKALELPPSEVRRAAMLSGDLGAVAKAGPGGLAAFAVQLFRPIKPMLAQTATDVAEALERTGPAAFEYKLDGARIQVHKRGEEVKVFSRLMNDVTAAVPEVVETAKTLKLKEAILDGEAIALAADGRPLPFQTTMRRFGRKLDVEALRGELPLVPFFFDILYVDGDSLMDQPYSTRFKVLSQHVTQRPPRRVTADRQEAQAFFDEAIKAGHEGLMAKKLDAPYDAGGRGWSWVKIKQANTLDLVVLAAEWGHGRRHGWLSNLHLGARDPTGGGGFVMLGKTFKGMTDELLEWQTAKLQELKVREVGGGHVVEVRPELVVEVAFNGLQESSTYPGGLALRFARVIRYRQDKKPEEADTIDTVRRLHKVSEGDRP
jgi:DNA ligase-1